jgi:chemotaxis signal transduction protein
MQDKVQLQNPACKSWVLSSGNVHVAIGEFELVYIIAGWQRHIRVPRCPVWCRHIFPWQGHLLPLFDMETYLNAACGKSCESAVPNRDFTGVVAYENRRGEIHYGGLQLTSPPVSRIVSDDEMCDYPDNYPEWDRIALSCFRDADMGPVPVLDIQKIFRAGQEVLAAITDNTYI